MHIRQQIREAVKTALSDLALTTYTNRVQNLDPDNLPAAVILTEDEASQQQSKDGDLDRTIDVIVVVIMDGDSETIDDDLDTWAEQIEPLLKSVPPAKQFLLSATSLDVRPDDEGSQWFGYLALEYKATAFTN